MSSCTPPQVKGNGGPFAAMAEATADLRKSMLEKGE